MTLMGNKQDPPEISSYVKHLPPVLWAPDDGQERFLGCGPDDSRIDEKLLGLAQHVLKEDKDTGNLDVAHPGAGVFFLHSHFLV